MLTLSGVNTYTGDTLVTAGSLVLSSGGESRFAIQNSGESNQFLGAGAITIDDLFRIDMSGLTDTTRHLESGQRLNAQRVVRRQIFRWLSSAAFLYEQ